MKNVKVVIREDSNLKNKKGITLIALVITIILLLILAGITISQLSGNGLFQKAELATNETNKQIAIEKMNLKITSIQMEYYVEDEKLPTLQYLADCLCEDNEIQYVALEKQKTSSIDKIIVGNNKAIYTKLKDYPYEFEINSLLQLASINGIKVATTENNNGSLSTGECNINISSNGKIHVNNIDNMISYSIVVNDICIDTTKEQGYALRIQPETKANVYVIAIDKNAKLYKSNIVSFEQKYTDFRYIKINISKLREIPSEAIIQLAEWEFYDFDKNIFNYPSNTNITCSLATQYFSPLNISNKTYNDKFSAYWGNEQSGECEFIIDLGEGNSINAYDYPYYSYYTAGDMINRDPVSWKMYGSKDGETYILIDEKDDTTITERRNTRNNYWTWGE